MSLQVIFGLLILAGLFGIGIGYVLRWLVALGKKGSMELEIKRMMLEAKEEAKRVVQEAEEKAKETDAAAKKEAREREAQLKKLEDRLLEREETIEKKRAQVEADVEKVREKIEEVRQYRERAEALIAEREKALANVAKMQPEDAKAELMGQLEKAHEEDLMVRLQKLEIQGMERLEEKAREILTTAIHRIGNSVIDDVMATTVMIPNDEIKGKIIGKEGRNIRAFERATGVDVIIDDTPGTITLSAFDPVRRHIARVALENLIIDGRIQPAKIEEVVAKATGEINKIMKEKGEQAAFEAGVHGLDPRLVQILGRLHFRTSYGQNVLYHSIEMAHIAGLLAEELGADPAVARAGALLHDIGKAVDHEVQGTHVEIGRRILQKFNVDERVIKAMQAHHEEYPYETTESIIVQVADAVSGGRPGARRDSVENYLKRLEDLEAIANRQPGVEKSYAIQAGREIRVFVRPEDVTDMEARNLARKIALEIENELKYPGEIKVAIIRESRSIEFAR